jgi:hypothetical protein
MDMQSIVPYLNMKDLSPIDIYRDLVTTLRMNILGYSTMTKYIQEHSCCSRNEDNEIHDQDSPIKEVDDAILQALADESSHQCMN